MIVTWIAIQSQPLPWEERRTDVAYVACGESAGELTLVRPEGQAKTPAIERLLDSIEAAIAIERRNGDSASPNLAWLRRAMPDQGTSIRLSSLRRCQAVSYEEQVRLLQMGSGPSVV